MRRGAMRGVLSSSLATAMLLMTVVSATPAVAGTEADPEITDPCGTLPSRPPTSMDICSGWFQGLWRLAPAEGDPASRTWVLDGLQITLRLAGDVQDRPDYAQYSVWWSVDDCRDVWLFWAQLDDGQWRARWSHICPEGRPSFSAPIPAEHVTVGTDRITVRLMTSEELAPIADSLFRGQQLTNPTAQVDLNFETSARSTTIGGWDTTNQGRAFVIGQDSPADAA